MKQTNLIAHTCTHAHTHTCNSQSRLYLFNRANLSACYKSMIGRQRINKFFAFVNGIFAFIFTRVFRITSFGEMFSKLDDGQCLSTKQAGSKPYNSVVHLLSSLIASLFVLRNDIFKFLP